MKIITAISFGLAITASSFSALADDYDAEDIIEYREDIMDAIKHHNNAIKAILTDKVPFQNQLDMHMSSLENLLGDVGELFPEGSDFGDTNAKEEIWSKPEKFSAAVKKAQQEFADFKAIVAKGDNKASAKALKNFGKESCGNCHKSFKKKDD